MPIDPMMLDATLGTFKNMAKEIADKGLTGSDVDEMNNALARLEQLGQELSDFNEFNATVMNENLYGKFSDHYGRALAAEGQANAGGEDGSYDDAALLKQSVDALKNAIAEIKRSKQEAIDMQDNQQMSQSQKDFVGRQAAGLGIELDATALQEENNNIGNAKEIEVLINDKALTKPIQDLIDLGEQEGMTLPKWLRIQIETGMDKAMEGTVVQKEGYEYDLGWNKANPVNPYIIEKTELKMKHFNEKAASAPFNVPDGLEISLYNDKIDREFEPKIIIWNDIIRRWESIIYRLEMLVYASSSVYPSYAPWKFILNHNMQRELAESIKDTYPGIIEQELILLKRYHGLSFEDIFTHETFLWEVKHYYLGYSQEFINYLKDEVFPECVPCEYLSQNTIDRFENDFHNQNKIGNPESHLISWRMRDFYDSVFGAGRYEEKFEVSEQQPSNTAPWSI